MQVRSTLLRGGLVAVMAVGGLVGGGASPASAAQYDGTYADQSYDGGGRLCSATATTVYTVSMKDKFGATVGKLELRYSSGCRTAWSRLTNYYTVVPGDAHSGYTEVQRNNGTKYGCYTPAGTNQYCYTKQVNDVNPYTSRAYGDIDPYPDYYGTITAYTPYY